MNFDATKNNPASFVAVTRAEAEIHVKWNPNNGAISIASGGLTPMEEIGVLASVLKLRSDKILSPTEPSRVEIAKTVPSRPS